MPFFIYVFTFLKLNTLFVNAYYVQGKSGVKRKPGYQIVSFIGQFI